MGVPRKIVQIAAAATSGESRIFALADDGTAWVSDTFAWAQIAGLPEAEACGARTRDVEGECRLPKGHRDHHWSGGRRWL